jgi:hypothetical protein
MVSYVLSCATSCNPGHHVCAPEEPGRGELRLNGLLQIDSESRTYAREVFGFQV